MDLENGWWSEPPDEQARRIVGELESSSGDHWSSAGLRDGPWGAAQVCRFRPSRVLHVVGTSEMAERLREIYGGSEVAGSTLYPRPGDLTPLHHFYDALVANGPQPGSERGYNLLDRHGFAFAEEVQACPDSALLELRNFGPTALASVRAVLGAAPALAERVPQLSIGRRAPNEVVPERQRYLSDNLSAPAAARYREFALLLSRSQVPLAALDKICTALNDEPVPPTDPLVSLLLETAGEPNLLGLYLSTHVDADAVGTASGATLNPPTS